jgi:UDP-N-acetylglucosamine--N-acetylmuramyl-(pentapeptide) pyrophosphoryl-undecaprenol N-acetylglucosamine transferase
MGGEMVGRRVLACASSGGHFKQLVRLVDRLPDVGEVVWLTYDSGLSDDLLVAAGRGDDRVVHAPHAAPRDVVNLARDARVAGRLLREDRYDLVVSTGAGIAVATLPLARAKGVRAVFIESATRAEGPSMSGRILQRVPGIELYTQNPGYAARWGDIGSVHDEFIGG